MRGDYSKIVYDRMEGNSDFLLYANKVIPMHQCVSEAIRIVEQFRPAVL